MSALGGSSIWQIPCKRLTCVDPCSALHVSESAVGAVGVLFRVSGAGTLRLRPRPACWMPRCHLSATRDDLHLPFTHCCLMAGRRHDDGISDWETGLVLPIAASARNPDGCHIPVTWFGCEGGRWKCCA